MGKKKEKKEINEKVDVEAVEIEDDTWCWLTHKGIGATFLCISVFALLVRVAVSLHPYSGAGSPPKFGDYEAQRHWMEITLNLPVLEWYRNSTGNDLSYWGLDYPPLTAYQSYFHGLFLRFFDPDSVSLFTSRGYETYVGKLLMRWTVLSSDTLIFFPAIFYFAFVYHSSCHSSRKNDCAWHIAMLLFNPCLILIDHGHFQYNCISLGLTVAAIAAILSQSELLASCLFTLALSHKQMSVYYAPAFFSHLLGKCLRRKNPIHGVAKLGLTVLGTFTVVWWPYLHSTDALLGVLSRLAPFERGIYEDYVANFWCTSSVIIKWKRLFSVHSLKFISLTATVLTCLPSMVQQVMAPSSRGFLYGLLNSSFAHPVANRTVVALVSSSRLINKTKIKREKMGKDVEVAEQQGGGGGGEFSAKDYHDPPPAPLIDFEELGKWSFYRAVIAEFIATLLFLYVTVLTVIGYKSQTDPNLNTDQCGGVGILGIAWAFGGMIFILVYCTAGISGGHINPAVTFGLFLGRKVSLIRALLYMVAQCLGAICGCGFVKAFQKSYYNRYGGGANELADGYNKGTGLGAEIIGTFVLVYTVFSATDPKRSARDSHVPVLAPLPIGFAVFMVHLATIPITGTGINPARSFGAAVIYNKEKAWDDQWIFWVGPFIGAFVAAFYHQYILRAAAIKALGSFRSNA